MTLSTRRLNPETLESILKWHSSQHNQSNRWFLLPVHNVVVVLKCCLEIEEAEVEGEEGGHRDQEQGADIVCDPALGLMKMITLTWSPRGHYLGAPHVAAPQGDDVAHDPGNIGGHDASKYGWCLSSGSQVVTGIWPVDNMCALCSASQIFAVIVEILTFWLKLDEPSFKFQSIYSFISASLATFTGLANQKMYRDAVSF